MDRRSIGSTCLYNKKDYRPWTGYYLGHSAKSEIEMHYAADTGKAWDNVHYLPHVTTKAGPTVGTVLMQLTGQRQLKMEIFAGKTASQVIGLDAAAELFER